MTVMNEELTKNAGGETIQSMYVVRVEILRLYVPSKMTTTSGAMSHMNWNVLHLFLMKTRLRKMQNCVKPWKQEVEKLPIVNPLRNHLQQATPTKLD